MSRIGNKEIVFSEDIQVVLEGNIVKVSGPKGVLQRSIPEGITLNIESGKINVNRNSEEKRIKAFHGLTRSLVNNMVIGVKEGFQKSLDIIGTGYKCDIKSKNELVLNLGYSNPAVSYTHLTLPTTPYV